MRYVYKLEDGSYAFSSNIPSEEIYTQVPVEIENENTNFYLVTDNLVNGELIGYNISLDDGTKLQAEQQALLLNESIEKYKLLNDQIIEDAVLTSGTTNQISALMDLITYNRMKEQPALFDQEGLVAKKDIGSFNKGDALDTALKITQYAEAMLAETDAFMIRRLKKITNYILS